MTTDELVRPALPITEVVNATYVVSLLRKPERWQAAEKQLKEIGFNPQQFPAVDGFTEPPERLKEIGVIDPRPGIAGCAASHITLWREIIRAQFAYTLVCEDDVVFHEDFAALFPVYWQHVPLDAEVIFVGHCDPSLRHEQGHVVRKIDNCTHTYIISLRGAEYLLEKTIPCDRPIDGKMIQAYSPNMNAVYLFNGTKHPSRVQIERGCQECFGAGLAFQNRADLTSTIHRF